jgi:hypothetical protein
MKTVIFTSLINGAQGLREGEGRDICYHALSLSLPLSPLLLGPKAHPIIDTHRAWHINFSNMDTHRHVNFCFQRGKDTDKE